jgi:transcriptional regulator with XRE-family HTH domain
MNYESFHKKVAIRIKQIRLSKNLTQEAMEEGAYGINARTYQRIENMETDISLKNLFLISQRLGVDIEVLLKSD